MVATKIIFRFSALVSLFFIIWKPLEAFPLVQPQIRSGNHSKGASKGIIQPLKHRDRLGPCRENGKFQIFSTLKVSGYRTLDKKIRDDSKKSAYGDRCKDPSIKLSNFPRIIGEAWNELKFFESKIMPSYTKSTFGPSLSFGYVRDLYLSLDFHQF